MSLAHQGTQAAFVDNSTINAPMRRLKSNSSKIKPLRLVHIPLTLTCSGDTSHNTWFGIDEEVICIFAK